VRQKERLKALRAEVDVLTLTATPIPRTMALSLEGIRDFSVIATAPQRRLAIKTFVRQETASLIREACLREMRRGGQIYFLHNEVETIGNRRARLAELVPEARIEIAHGQMPERELERVMRDFYSSAHVLLCTTIIETGIDVPSANTIIIHRADRFGLAQLHQLRGRVGRSHHQAYAYLMIPDPEALTKNARSAWRRSRTSRNSAAASTSRCTTWRSAAPARFLASRRAATCRRWASTCTRRCSMPRARAALGPRARLLAPCRR